MKFFELSLTRTFVSLFSSFLLSFQYHIVLPTCFPTPGGPVSISYCSHAMVAQEIASRHAWHQQDRFRVLLGMSGVGKRKVGVPCMVASFLPRAPHTFSHLFFTPFFFPSLFNQFFLVVFGWLGADSSKVRVCSDLRCKGSGTRWQNS